MFINLSNCLQMLHRTINYRMAYLNLPRHPSIAKTCLWHANSLPPQFSPNHNLAMKTLSMKNSTISTSKHTLCYKVRHQLWTGLNWTWLYQSMTCYTLIKTYVYRYSSQQSHFLKSKFSKKNYVINQVVLNFCQSVFICMYIPVITSF